MPRVEPVRFSMITKLMVDALYFHAARRAHEEASEAHAKVESAEEYWTSLDEKWKRIEETVTDPSDQYDLLEPLGPQLEGADYRIGVAYGAVIKGIATVHILSTAALEAHINTIGRDGLHGKDYDHFERLSLEAKWLFLPRFMGLEPFDPGRQPFQGFSRLIKLRDKLVHYKGMKEEWISGQPPRFLATIGLTLRDSTKAIETAKGMITALARSRNVEPPYWLRADLNEMDYFHVDVVSQ